MGRNKNMSTNGTTETTETKGPTLLASMHEVWVKAGSKTPDAKTLAAVKKDLKAADEAYAAAEKALEEARKARHAAAEKAIKVCGGKTSLNLGDGRIVQPFCRGDALFYRSVNQSDVL